MPKEEIDRDTDQNDYNTRNGSGCAIQEQDCQNNPCTDQVKQRNQRIAESAVGPLGVRLRLPQSKYAGNG